MVGFTALFAKPAALLATDWWNDPEAGHGLLLAPAAIWLAWKSGLRLDRVPQPILGAVILAAAVLFRLAAELAAELFVMRGSMILALSGVTTFFLDFRQVLNWRLPFPLLALAVPLFGDVGNVDPTFPDFVGALVEIVVVVKNVIQGRPWQYQVPPEDPSSDACSIPRIEQ